MSNYESRHIIEALRSGIPSRTVSQYFCEARPNLLKEISLEIENCRDNDKSKGMIISGKYGEGKTHLLNTVFNIAHNENFVVSYISLSKETPMNNLPLLYQKIISNTYLPNREQAGLLQIFDKLTPNSPIVNDLLLYAGKELETDKLYYLLKAYLNTEDSDEKYQLQSDLEGDIVGNPVVKNIYKRIFNQTVKFSTNFSKTKHITDYFSFMSYMFKKLGYSGWVILFDEVELIGRFSKKARLNAYRNMANFLKPQSSFHSVFSLFAISASYEEDVIEAKHDYENLEELYPDEPEPIKSTLNTIVKADQLVPLTKEETFTILKEIQKFHGEAYDWNPEVSIETMNKVVEENGYLLRTKIRAAIEFLDQLYLYGEACDTKITELGKETFEEDNTPSLQDILE